MRLVVELTSVRGYVAFPIFILCADCACHQVDSLFEYWAVACDVSWLLAEITDECCLHAVNLHWDVGVHIIVGAAVCELKRIEIVVSKRHVVIPLALMGLSGKRAGVGSVVELWIGWHISHC